MKSIIIVIIVVAVIIPVAEGVEFEFPSYVFRRKSSLVSFVILIQYSMIKKLIIQIIQFLRVFLAAF